MPTAAPPISAGYPGNAGSAREAAMVTNQQNANLLNALNKSGKGGRKTKRHRGGAATNSVPSTVAVPVIQPMFPDPAGTSSQGIVTQTTGMVGQHNQLSMNNEMTGSKVSPAQPIPPGQLKSGGGCGCDLKGGKRKRKRKRSKRAGTNIMGPNRTWGCYSGGKKRKTKRTSTRRRKRTTTKKYGKK